MIHFHILVIEQVFFGLLKIDIRLFESHEILDVRDHVRKENDKYNNE